MTVQKESKLAQWIDALREGWPGIRARFDEWVGAVREEPILIWQTTAVRYTVYGVVALIAFWAVTWGVDQLAPPDAAPPAETADFHVLCTARSCGHHFIINEEFSFDDFPVRCPKCKGETGGRALRCAAPGCTRWVVPKVQEGEYHCPQCGGYLGEEP
ncbi:MAG: hypothetical protein GY842_00455 [bacterium]|nr:hypothetical protein [bacterium]